MKQPQIKQIEFAAKWQGGGSVLFALTHDGRLFKYGVSAYINSCEYEWSEIRLPPELAPTWEPDDDNPTQPKGD